MDWLVPLVIVGIVVVLIAIRITRKSEHVEDSPYTKNHALFSPAERSFLGVLEQAISEDHRVFGKVRVADVVSVKASPDRSSWQQAFNRISAKHIDFVLCRSDNLAVVAAIELDDVTHKRKKRQARDAFIVDLCNDINLPLIQIPAQATYTVSTVRELVMSVVNNSHEAGFSSGEVEVPLCPRCTAPMVRRKAKTGANVGREFWGCSTFPKCRGIISTDNND